ncbi:MAG TPA: metal ABC transporter permease [Herpetosiphonaceae bacterium]|nr:metal ABC transporter permease [Herpetosiphonaceae bacterium]
MFEPFQFAFFRHGVLAAVLAGGLCGLIGVYIVLRSMSYIGHGLSHAIFGGAVVSYVIGVNFYLGAGLWGFGAALLINQVTRRTRINADAVIGIITTASFAVGVAIISRFRSFTRSFDAALFGNILGVERADLLVIGAVAIMVAGFVLVCYRGLLFNTFSSETAQVYGIKTGWLDTLFALMLAAVLIATMQIMGVTLIAAALVIPPTTARLLTSSFHRLMIAATLIGAGTGFVGMLASYHFDLASGATIVLSQATCFCLALAAWALRGRRGRFGTHVH